MQTVRFALAGIAANKLRTALTTLGILIGVAVVIVVVAVGNGSARAVQSSIAGLGTTTISVRSGSATFGRSTTTASGLTAADATALVGAQETPDVAAAAPVVSTSATVAASGTSTTVGQVLGTTPSYLDAASYGVTAGSPFTDSDEEAARKVVLLGTSVVTDLFPAQDPVGEQVLVGGVPFTVVGVIASQGTSSGGQSDADAVAIAPLSTVQRSLTGFGDISSITAQATSADTVEAASAQITSVLGTRHGVTSSDDAGFTVTSATALLSTSQEATSTFTVLLAAVAGISLLVGGIGVTNIMLVTVTERTREIGVRKALGATPGVVLGQFLLEAVLLSLLGGGLGVLVGLVVSRFPISGVQPVVVPASVVLALGVCVAIGLFFGGYPAHRAARLRPVDALRHE